MKVKRSSWHYKASNFGNGGFENRNDNLCWYFWRLIFKVVVGVAFTIVICMMLYAYFTSPLLIPHTILLLFFVAIFAVPIAVIYLIRKKFGKSPEMPYGNIVAEYIKAKKNKVCPLIEYVD